MHKPKWDETVTAAENARAILPVLADSYFDSGRKLIAHKHNAEKLHRFRLKTKQFRYTLEMFREVYGPNLESRLELLRPIQSALGDINDCAATLDLLDARGSRTMKEFLDKRAEKKTKEFEEYWRNTFDAPGRKAAWVNYLTRFAGRRGR